MTEIWRNVVGYEGYYEVSNWGRVKSLSRMTKKGVLGGRILKPSKNGYGYLTVNLSKDGKRKTFKVHRLVGIAFADMVEWTEDAKGRPFSELTINHLKEDCKSDNHVENLQWCPLEGNLKYGTHNERVAKTLTNGKTSKTVYQYTLNGEFVREWPSLAEIYRQTGFLQGNISKCCNGERNSAYGFKWSYNKH